MRITFACLVAGWVASSAFASPTINEIRVDETSTDNSEYFELAGLSGESLAGLSYIVIGDTGTTSGIIETIVNMSGAVPADGYFLAAETTFLLGGSVDLSLAGSGVSQTLNYENSDNVTHLLVSGLNPLMDTGDGFGAGGSNVDANNDGIIDATGDWNGDSIDDGAPWTAILDSVAFSENVPLEDKVYSSTVVGPDGTFAPGHIYRFPNGTGSWNIGTFDPAPPGGDDTPGVANVPEPASMALMLIGGLVALRRRR